jgi:MATE family multidrug resistance protein
MQIYLAIRLLSIGPAVGSEALGNWYGGLGDTRPSMIAGIVAMVVNVVAAYLLIEPHLGLPGYGVGGAAAASVVATWLGFGVLFVRFLRDRRGQPGIMQLGLKGREMLRMLRFGLPNGVNWFLEFGAFALFINLVVGHLGTTALAAFNVVMQLNSVSFMPAFGLSSAGAIMVGEAIGRKAHDEVWPTLKLTCGAACAWMGTVGLVYVAGSSTLMRWFHPQDLTSSSFAAIGTRILGFSALWQLCDAVTMSCSETLRAAGDTAWCMAARIALAWVFFLPISWVAIFHLGGGVGTAMGVLVAYMIALSATMALRFASGKWRSIELVEAEPSVL